jgi:hypothetical protein
VHRVDIFLQSSELGPPTRIPSSFGTGGGTHSLAGEGVGGPNSDEGGQTLWYSRYISTLCVRVFVKVDAILIVHGDSGRWA